MVTQLIPTFVPALALAASAADQLDFPSLARTYVEQAGIENPAPHSVTPHELLTKTFVGARIGAFHVHFPVSALDEKKQFRDVQFLAEELLKAQVRWLEWMAPTDAAEEEIEELEIEDHAERIQDWISGWRRSRIERDWRIDGVSDFTPRPEDDEREAAAARALIEYLGRGGPLKTSEEPALTPVYLVPTRKEFVELACLFGWVYPNLRHEYWTEETWSWTQFFYEDAWFVALEFAAAVGEEGEKQGFSGDYTRGTPMAAFNKKGLEQQVVQLSFRALFKNMFGNRISPTFSAGFSSALVIDLYGEVDTRTDGDLRPGKSQARSVFVPGGASGGGALPPSYADGRFRDGINGADWFVRILQKVQKHGAKRAESRADEHRCFVILDDDTSGEFLLKAPVLHFTAEKTVHPPSEDFQGDLLEFLRAYRICFVYWLRHHAEDSERTSQRVFAEFLAVLGSPDGSLDLALERAYERPLSDEDVSRNCLEGQFLRWLEDQ